MKRFFSRIASSRRNDSSTDQRLSFLVLGDIERSEFAEALKNLSCWGKVCQCADMVSANQILAAGEFQPDVILIVQAYPGRFWQEDIESLRRQAPLARVVALLGSWCEGEMRTGFPYPGVARVYWHQWSEQARCEFQRLLKGYATSWALPPTATEEERILCDIAGHSRCRPATISSAKTVAICSSSREMLDWLVSALHAYGLSAVGWLTDEKVEVRAEGICVAVFDVAHPASFQLQKLQSFVSAIQPVPVVALMSFPRIEDVAMATTLGVKKVLSKPLMLENLIAAIDDISRNIRQEAGIFS